MGKGKGKFKFYVHFTKPYQVAFFIYSFNIYNVFLTFLTFKNKVKGDLYII